jgi:hypothetical protein
LYNLLGVFCTSDSKDPRDKIYILLGLIRGHTDFGIIPDYNISVDDLFRTVSTAMIKLYQTLQLLGLSPLSILDKRLSVFLSWCLDWSRDAFDTYTGGPITSIYEFHADSNIGAKIYCHQNPNLLTVYRKLVDMVGNYMILFKPLLVLQSELCTLNEAVRTKMLEFNCYGTSFLDSCLSLANSVSQKSKSKTDIEGLWYILIGGLNTSRELAGNLYSEYYHLYKRFLRHRSRIENLDNDSL